MLYLKNVPDVAMLLQLTTVWLAPRGVLRIIAYMGRLRLERGTFFRAEVYERAGISLVKVYKRG